MSSLFFQKGRTSVSSLLASHMPPLCRIPPLACRAYHLTRSGFFMLQGLASLLVTRRAVGRDAEADSLTRFEEMVRRSWSGPATEAMLMFWQASTGTGAGCCVSLMCSLSGGQGWQRGTRLGARRCVGASPAPLPAHSFKPANRSHSPPGCLFPAPGCLQDHENIKEGRQGGGGGVPRQTKGRFGHEARAWLSLAPSSVTLSGSQPASPPHATPSAGMPCPGI